MNCPRRFCLVFAFAVFFSTPVFAADFESDVKNGLFKENSIETAHFHIEFSNLILDQTDSDGDGISDVIEVVAESAESAWDEIISDMDYDAPQDMSTGVMIILDDNYEYLDYGALGITSLLSNGNPYIAVDPWISESIIMVTVGHEFFHAVQFGYDPNFAYTYQGINWAEATATWMEDILFDSVNDYIYYLPDYFDYPDYSIFASIVPSGTLFEYGMSIWPRFLSEYYDNSVIKEVWENYFNSSTSYDSDLKVYEAMKDMIESQGDDLSSLYHEFALWNLDVAEFYEEGDTYPSVFFIPEIVTDEYAQIEDAYAPALFGSNYFYFSNDHSEKNFYFHIIKPEGAAFKISLVPYNAGSYNMDDAVSAEIGQDEEMDTYLSIGNMSSMGGVVAVVSNLDIDFDDGYNWGVFDDGYTYEYLASYDDTSDAFNDLMGAESGTVDEGTEGKEGDEVDDPDEGKTEEALTLSVLEYDEDSVTFSWNRLDDDSVDGYELRYESKYDGDSDEKEIENAYTTFATVDDLETGELYLFQLFALDSDGDTVSDPSAEIAITPEEWIFEDVSYQHEHYSAINALVEAGIFQGYGDDTFRPNDEINRAELLKILVEGRGIEVSGAKYKNCFSDVHEEWYAKYICYAKDQGWIRGYPNNTFRPANSVNKVEALKMMFMVYEAGLTEGANVAKLNYTDVDTEAWYAIYLWKASMLGILEEPFGGEFDPENARTRGEMAEELYRYLVVIESL